MMDSLLQAISGMGYQSEAVAGGLDEECVTDRYAAAAFGWRTAVEMVTEAIGSHGRDGWIPCSERLPKEPGDGLKNMVELDSYIVMIQGAEKPTSLIYAGDGEWYDAETGIFYKVEAWRPYPPAYRPQKSVGDDYKRQIMERFCRVE